MKKLSLLIVLLIPVILHAQDESKPGPVFSGFVKNNILYDSRQVVSLYGDNFLLYPAARNNDLSGSDMNARASLNIISMESQLTGRVGGPDVFGAKTSGLFEGDFLGYSGMNLNSFSLRQAFVKFNWTATDLLIGQTWHPMLIPECTPGVVSYNNGAPFQPYSRNPQVRIGRTFGNMKLIVAALEQNEFTSPGGAASLRNALIPDIQIGLQYNYSGKDKGTEILAGIGGGYKQLQPRLVTDSLYKTDKKVNGVTYQAYLKYKNSFITFKCMAVAGEDLYDLMMLGGYVYKYSVDSTVIKKNDFDYTTIHCYSLWADISTAGTKFQAGLFAGYTGNTGSSDNINTPVYNISSVRGYNIRSVYRISPRIIYLAGKMKFEGEIEYTSAAYGNYDIQGLVYDTKEISNIRALIAISYSF